MNILNFISENWELLLPLLYELLVRLFPTKKNWSVIDLLLKLLPKILDKAVPNRRVIKCIIFLLLISMPVFSQQNSNVKSIAFKDSNQMGTDTVASTWLIEGRMWYNTASQKLRFYSNDSTYTIFPVATADEDSVFGLSKVDVLLDSIDIQNMSTTPPELIPAPGAGKYIQVTFVYFEFIWNSTAFDFPAGTFSVHTSAVETSNSQNAVTILNGTADASILFHPGFGGSYSDIAARLNQPLTMKFTTGGADATVGNSSVRWVIYYYITDVN
jgi:hypothetical protein